MRTGSSIYMDVSLVLCGGCSNSEVTGQMQGVSWQSLAHTA